VFVHGPQLLFDTPEESRLQLARAGIREVAAGFYSHWHPDHTLGVRVWESLAGDWRTWPPELRRRVETPVYLPQQVAVDARERLALRQHLDFLASQGYVRVVELEDGESVEICGCRVTPLRLAEDYVYAFVLEHDGRRVLLAPDELNGWTPPGWVRGVDLAVLPRGLDEHDPFTGERRLHEEHPLLQAEATFVETLAIVDELAARRVVLSHVEELDGLGYDDLLRLEELQRGEGRELTFAYDGLVLEV
jgi:phosphoribosyl 1,2-cyclic phosphate phosphodiesterase